MSKRNYTAFLVEDNLDDLRLLELNLKQCFPDLKIVGTADSVKKAIKVINTAKPNLLFLDVNLKDRPSFELVDQLEDFAFELIFITSYHEYASKAYRYDARDYLVNPIAQPELVIAVNRAIRQINLNEREIDGVNQSNANLGKLDIPVLALPTTDGMTFIDIEGILYCAADGKYTRFYTDDGKSVLSSRNLGEYELLLPPKFFRIHHKYLVNLTKVESIERKKGNYCQLRDSKTTLPVAKRRKHALACFLKLK